MPPIDDTSAVARLARAIAADIAARRMRPEMLLTVDEVARMYAARRIIARDALALIDTLGALERQRSGAFAITSPLPADVLSLFEVDRGGDGAAAHAFGRLLDRLTDVAPGAPLPLLVELAAELDLSLRALRGALSSAAPLGLVVQQPGRPWHRAGFDFTNPHTRRELLRFAAQLGCRRAALLVRAAMRPDAKTREAGRVRLFPPAAPTCLGFAPTFAGARILLAAGARGRCRRDAAHAARRVRERRVRHMTELDLPAGPTFELTSAAAGSEAAGALRDACMAWASGDLSLSTGVQQHDHLIFAVLPQSGMVIATGTAADHGAARVAGALGRVEAELRRHHQV